jgi:phage replication-related protein YjqB (UPF0714/DUF867 family)
MDKYNNFSELKRNEVEGSDYRIHIRNGHSGIAIVAPHGGKIERGTMQIADAIAGNEHTYYCFEGIKKKRNYVLHITSNHFDEPRCIEAIRKSEKVISIHGAMADEPAVYAGGLDDDLKKNILLLLSETGFKAMHDPSPTRQGNGKSNICNCGTSGVGVQIEITGKLRRMMFNYPDDNKRRHSNNLFTLFVQAIRNAISAKQT